MKRLPFFFLLLSTWTYAAEVLAPEAAFKPTARFVDARSVELRYTIAPGYYLYRNKFSFAADAKNIAKAEFPVGEMKQDPFFGRVEIYRDSVTIRLPINQGAQGTLIEATSQGCADVGICYPPITQRLRPTKP
jgi:thioredoxin:protein disulfide reductase